jgi:hypothetical protein
VYTSLRKETHEHLKIVDPPYREMNGEPAVELAAAITCGINTNAMAYLS